MAQKEEKSIETVYHELNHRLQSNFRELKNTILLCIYDFHNSRSYQAQGFGVPSAESTLDKLHEPFTRGSQMGIHTLI